MNQFSSLRATLAGLLTPSRRDIAGLVWMALVTIFGLRLAAESALSALHFLRQQGDGGSAGGAALAATGGSLKMVIAAGVVGAALLAAVLAAHRWRPAATLPALTGVALAIILAVAIATSSLGPLVGAVAIAVAVWAVGRTLLTFLPGDLGIVPASVRCSLSFALGLAVTGMTLLALGSVGWINQRSLLAVLVFVLVLALVRFRTQFSPGAVQVHAIRLTSPGWFETSIVLLTIAVLVYALLAPFTPETLTTASDSVRQHLPMAREIWQDGAVLMYPTLDGPNSSNMGQTLYALAYGFGGVTSIRLFQAMIGLVAIQAVYGLGVLVSGRLAGVLGGCVFACLPLTLWLTGHANPDLIAALFACAAVQSVLLWLRGWPAWWLGVTGILAGAGMATKQISVVWAAAILLVAVAVNWNRRPLSDVLRSIVAFIVGVSAVVLPWFARTFVLTGEIPLLGTIISFSRRIPFMSPVVSALPAPVQGLVSGTLAVVASQPNTGGVEASVQGILLSPWVLTFAGAPENYRVVRFGEIGIVILLLLPFAIAQAVRSRELRVVAFAAALPFVGWVFTLQVTRHLLPTLALLSAMAGVAAAAAVAARRDGLPMFTPALQIAMVVGIALTPVFYIPNLTTRIPVDVLTGQVSAADYVDQVDPAAAALHDATRLLPPDANTGFIGEWLGSQIETEVRLVYLGQYTGSDANALDAWLGTTPQDVDEKLRYWNIHSLIWDRVHTRDLDIDSTVLSGDFLLNYTTIIGGDHGVYLYDLDGGYPANALAPERDLLRDAGGAAVSTGDATSPVAVTSGNAYLILLDGSCKNVRGSVTITVNWLDASGNVIETTADVVQPGTRQNTSLMWRIAPSGVTRAAVSIDVPERPACTTTGVRMFDVTSLSAAASDAAR